ncbi:MAG: radical SAM protein [Candidatus Woesearchaeota archaeon]
MCFSGGEPFSRPDIAELIAAAKNEGFSDIWAISNGRMLSKQGLAKKVVQAGLTGICISCHSSCKDLNNYLAGKKDNFRKVKNALANLRQYKIRISSNTVVMKSNCTELAQIIDFLIRNGVNAFSSLVFVMPSENAWLNRWRLVPRVSSVIPYVIEAINFGKSKGFLVNTEGFPFCLLQGYENHISEFAMPLEWSSDTPESFHSDHLQHIRDGKARSEECGNCLYNSQCGGIWVNYAKIYPLDEFCTR